MLGIAVTFIVCLVPCECHDPSGLPACIVVLFSGAGLGDYFSLHRLGSCHVTPLSTMAVAPAAAAPIATAANTRVTTMSAAEIATLSTIDEDFYSISREHLFASKVICTSVLDPARVPPRCNKSRSINCMHM